MPTYLTILESNLTERETASVGLGPSTLGKMGLPQIQYRKAPKGRKQNMPFCQRNAQVSHFQVNFH
jgi:hypothetical protein